MGFGEEELEADVAQRRIEPGKVPAFRKPNAVRGAPERLLIMGDSRPQLPPYRARDNVEQW